MYVPKNDEVIALEILPPCEPGAPIPLVLADEHRVLLSYYAREPAAEPNPWADVAVSDPQEEPVALVEFSRCYAHLFGPPNDEAFTGHPLSRRGLLPYTFAEIRHSSWIAALEQMNAVHPYHHLKNFLAYRHYILPFHDSTFECVAESFTLRFHRGSVYSAMSEALVILRNY